MARTETRTLYTLADLKAKHPEAYAKVHARWQDACDSSGDTPWADETMASLSAVVEACGATLKDYGIGAYAPSHVSVECDDEYEDEDGEMRAKDSAWLMRTVLAPLGYAKDGKPYFPGLCAWTGYCADDDMIEAVSKAMDAGESLTDALRGLADVAQREMEDNQDQMRDEESMDANWSDNEYTEDGRDA